jgi:hypothetical protein
MRLRKRPVDIVGEIPDSVWYALTTAEHSFLLAVGDTVQGKHTPEEMRRRIEHDNEMRRFYAESEAAHQKGSEA